MFVAIGAYAILAFNRFGLQGFLAPRAPIRMLLVGLYGWLWLAGAVWLIARTRFRSTVPFGPVFRLIGQAHLPLLMISVTIQALAVSFRLFGPGLWVSVFSALFWMPALLTMAARTAPGITDGEALRIVIAPNLVWLILVGWYLQVQVGHLL